MFQSGECQLKQQWATQTPEWGKSEESDSIRGLMKMWNNRHSSKYSIFHSLWTTVWPHPVKSELSLSNDFTVHSYTHSGVTHELNQGTIQPRSQQWQCRQQECGTGAGLCFPNRINHDVLVQRPLHNNEGELQGQQHGYTLTLFWLKEAGHKETVRITLLILSPQILFRGTLSYENYKWEQQGY